MDITSNLQQYINTWITEKESPKWLNTFLTRGLPQWVSLVLVVLLAQQLAMLTWRFIPRTPQTQLQRVESPTSTAPVKRQASLVAEAQNIVNLHLFGRAGTSKTAPVQVAQKATETRLNLTLHGVFVEDKPDAGAAIIGKAGAKQSYYRVGHKVMSGVNLQAVFNDRVIISRDGKSEILRFPKDAKPISSGANLSTRTSQVAAKDDSLKGYREMFANEPLKIFEHVRFVPVRSGKTLKGYRVLPQRDRKLYNKLGIRPSDLVTGVNGVPLNDNKQAMELMNKLKDVNQIDLDIVRKGRAESISLSLN